MDTKQKVLSYHGRREGCPPAQEPRGRGGRGHVAPRSTEVAGPFELLCPLRWHCVLAKYLFKPQVPANVTSYGNRVFADAIKVR